VDSFSINYPIEKTAIATYTTAAAPQKQAMSFSDQHYHEIGLTLDKTIVIDIIFVLAALNNLGQTLSSQQFPELCLSDRTQKDEDTNVKIER
jgi:hypothetical protein